MAFPILAAIQAGAGLLGAKKKEAEAKRTNAARAALGEAPTADGGEGTMGALVKGIGGIADAYGKQAPEKPETPPTPAPLPNLPPPPPGPPNPALGSAPQGPPMTNPNSFVPEGTLQRGLADDDPNRNLIDYGNLD